MAGKPSLSLLGPAAPFASEAAVLAALAFGVLAFSLIGDWFVSSSMMLASPIAPATGLALAGALVFGPTAGCLAAFAGDFAAGWLLAGGMEGGIRWGGVAAAETLAGWLAVAKLARADTRFPNLAAFLRYLPAACFSAPLVRAAGEGWKAAGASSVLGIAFGAWQASALGTLIFGLLFLFLFHRQDVRPQTRAETYELLLAEAVLAGILYLLLTSARIPDSVFVFLLALCLVMAIAVAARMGLRPATLFLATFVFWVPAFVAMFPEKTGGVQALHHAERELGMSGALAFLAAFGCLLLGAFRDELAAIRTRFMLAMASADLAFWDWSREGWRIYTPSWAEKFGLPVGRRLPTETWFSLAEAEDRPRAQASFEAFAKQPGPDTASTWQCEYRVRSQEQGERWISSRGAILRRARSMEAEIVAGIHRDITEERNALEHRLAALRTEIELQRLRGQLNPHFLLNALNSIAALLGRRNDLAREMLLCLGGFLRKILSSVRRESVTVEEELALVRDYLGIEKIRFEERLRWAAHCSPEAARAHVPPLLLLTLVENAVKHGLARLERGGSIEIAAAMNGDTLEISVVNDGPLGPPGRGIGLETCRRGIELASDGRGELHLFEEPGPRVRAAVLLPLLHHHHETHSAR